ncbi:hypothetical protein AN191_15835 [Loktanella sp. 5RATIMAR09]|nr:hypothetical protein AN191_15835 [Loktanella sp. 5RATIMAR09]
MALEVFEMRADTTQIDEPINRPKELILGGIIFQRELLDQPRLRFLVWSHHRKSLPVEEIESGTYVPINCAFFKEHTRQFHRAERLSETLGSDKPLTDKLTKCL